MVDNERFAQWYSDEYLALFPKPPRNAEKWNDVLLHPDGISTKKQENYSYTVIMNQQEFTNFMVTQSNVVLAVEQGGRSLESVKGWFHQTLEPIFSGSSRALLFEGYIAYIQNKKH